MFPVAALHPLLRLSKHCKILSQTPWKQIHSHPVVSAQEPKSAPCSHNKWSTPGKSNFPKTKGPEPFLEGLLCSSASFSLLSNLRILICMCCGLKGWKGKLIILSCTGDGSVELGVFFSLALKVKNVCRKFFFLLVTKLVLNINKFPSYKHLAI